MNASAFSEPFTPRGVAAFGRAKFGRLLIAQAAFAFLGAAAVAWLCHDACFPTVLAAIEQLPDSGQISYGQLSWTGAPQTLAGGRVLSFDVDPGHSGQIASTADLQIEFGRQTVRFFSLFGYADFPYPPNQVFYFNRPQLEPLWNAWSAEILFLIALATFVFLPATWWILATLYFLPVWLLGFFTNRELSLRASLKLSGAALLPGALLMIAGIFLYDFGFLNLVSFSFVFAAHFVLSWLYLVFGLIFFPRTSAAPSKGNPFKRA